MLSKSKNENVPIILNQLNDEVYIRYPYHIYEIDWIHQSLILQAWFIRQNRKQMESQNQQTNNQWTHKNYRCSQTKSKRNPTNPKKNYRSSHSKSNESPKKITEGIKTRSKCKWRERERESLRDITEMGVFWFRLGEHRRLETIDLMRRKRVRGRKRKRKRRVIGK